MKTLGCQHCNKSYIPTPGSLRKYCSLSCSNKARAIKQKKTMEEKYMLNPVLCNCCNLPISFEKRKNKFCSHSCSAKITNLIERKRGPTAKEKLMFSKVEFLFCDKTQKWYSNKTNTGTTRKCSPYLKTPKEQYYNAARFKFNVYHYPEEFDIQLIEEHGWYSCPGKKRKYGIKNTLGVSRDHIISVSYGFRNNVDARVISHPANCRIMLHSENKRKSNECELTVEQLLKKIDIWDKKYTERKTRVELATSGLEDRCSTN